jgi:hypothetical protein
LKAKLHFNVTPYEIISVLSKSSRKNITIYIFTAMMNPNRKSNTTAILRRKGLVYKEKSWLDVEIMTYVSDLISLPHQFPTSSKRECVIKDLWAISQQVTVWQKYTAVGKCNKDWAEGSGSYIRLHVLGK